MPLYILNRDYIHRSLLGHTIAFIKGEPAWVPPGPIEREVYAIGAELVEGEAPELIDEPKAVVELSAEQREEELRAAFSLIVEKNNAKDFTAAGVPNVKAVEKLVSFSVEKVELDTLWQKIREEGGK